MKNTNATVKKTSVSLTQDNWKKLKDARNKSMVINTALDFFFAREEFLATADETYWQNVKQSLLAKDGEYRSLNKPNETLTNDVLEQKLWN